MGGGRSVIQEFPPPLPAPPPRDPLGPRPQWTLETSSPPHVRPGIPGPLQDWMGSQCTPMLVAALQSRHSLGAAPGGPGTAGLRATGGSAPEGGAVRLRPRAPE